ncbi:hypothetical protein SK128_019256 [Halocaridina rubra]|uniref:Uncharacterized protein n=1 Tax=Halocaridina rubra TaxID=373956 RepID=A0AAN9ACJ2_HALRR
MDERRFPQVVKSNRIRDICMDNNRESPCTQSRILKKNKSNKLQLNVGSTSHPAKGRKKKKQANKQKHLDVIDISSDYVNEQNYAVCDSNESICASELPLKSANGFCLDPTSMNNSQEKPSMMMMPSSKLRTTRSSGGDSLMDGLGSSLLTRKQSKRLKRRASFRAAKAKIKSSGRGRRSCLSQKLVRYDFATDSTKMTDFQSKSPNSIYSVSSYELHKTPDADSINAYKSSAEACGDTIKSDCDVIKNSDDNVSGCTQRGTPSKLLCNIKKTSTIWSTPIGICINDCSRSSVTAESNLGSCFEKNDKKNLKSKPSAISMNDKSCSDQSKKMNLRSLKPSTISKNNQSRSDPLERKMKEVGAAADDSSSIEILPSVLKLAKESSHCKSPSKKTRSGPDQNSSVTPKMANLAKATHSTLSTSKKFELKTLDSTLNSSTSETLTAKSASPNQKYEVNILESVSTVPNSGTMTPKSVNSGKKSGSKTLDSDSNLPKSGALNFKYGSPSKNSKVKAQESVSISLKSGALNPKSRSPSKKSRVTTSDSVSNSSTSGALNNKSGSPSKKSEVKTPDSVSNLSQSGALITNSDSPSRKSIVKAPDSVSNSPKSGALNPKILEVKTTDLVLDTPKYRTLTPKTELSSNKAEVQSPDLALNIVLKTASSSTNSQVKNPDSDPDLIQSGPYLPKIGSLTMKPEVKTSDLVSALPKSGTSRQKPGISCVVSDSAKYSTKSEVKTSDLVSVSPKSITLLPKAVTSNSISDSRKSGILNRQSNFPKDSTVIDAIDLTSSAVMENNNHSWKISEVKVPFAESASPAASELTLVAANATIPVVTIATASACTQVVRTAAANAMTPVVTTVTANAKSPVVTTAAANTRKPVVTTAIANTTIPVVMTATANANTPVVTTAAANDNTPVVLTSATNVNTPVVTTAAANANTPVALTSAADAKKVKDSSSRSLEASSSVELLLANSNSLITPSDGKEKNSSFSSDFDCVAEEEMQPFMTESVRKLIKKKRAAYCMYKQSQSAQLWKFYARLKKQVAEEVKRVSAEAGTQENMSKVKGRLAATQRVKLNHIVLLTDMMDMFLQDRLKKFVKVSFIHRQNLGYHNALHLITDHEWYGKGTLFVMMCGVTTAVRFVKQENCGDFCWMSLLERYSLVSSKTTDISNHLKESALLLRKDVEENKTDKIIFLGLLPIQLAAFDTYLLGRHFEITGHSVPHLHHRLYSEHQGVLCRSLGIFNKWVEADRNGIGYECWNLVDEPFMYYSARYQKMIFTVGTEPDGRVLSYQDFKKRLSSVKNAIDSSFNLWKERLVEDGQSNEKIFVNMDLKSHFKEKIEGGTAVCDGGISLVKSSDFSDTEPSKNNGEFDTDSAQLVKDGKESQVVKVIPDTIKIKPCTSKVNEAQINNKEKACNIIESPQNPVIHPLTTESSSPKAKSQKIDELHIVLICDKQDSYLQAMNLPNLSCIYSPNMTFTSALHLIEKTELPSSNVLYIVLCGIDNILLTIEEPECKQKKCLHILERPALMSNEVEGNLRALISEALYLRQKVSELRPLSHVVFSGILPANLFQMDNYAVIRHSNVCKHKAPLHTKDFFHPMSDVMNRVLTLYNSWAKEDAAMSGFPVWHVEQVFVSFHAVSKSEMACTFNHTTERDGRSLTLVAEKARKEALLRVVKYTQGEAIPQRPSCKEKYKERKFHPNSIVVAYGNSRGSLLSLNIDKLRDLVTCIQKEAVHARLQNGDIPERTLIVLLSDLDSVLKYQQDDDCKRLGCSSSLQRIELISENVDRLFSVLVSKAQTLRKNVLEMNRNCNIIFTGLLPVDLRVINELVLKDHLRQCHHQGTYRPKKALLGENRVLGSAVTYFNQWALRDAERLGFPDFRMESILTSIKSSKDQFVFLNKFEHDGWTPTNFWQKRHLEVLTNSLRMTLASLFYEDSVDEYPSLSSFHVSGSKLSPSKSTSQDEVRYGSIRPLDHKDTWFTSEAARYSPPASPIVLMSNTLYSHILQRFSSPSVSSFPLREWKTTTTVVSSVL